MIPVINFNVIKIVLIQRIHLIRRTQILVAALFILCFSIVAIAILQQSKPAMPFINGYLLTEPISLPKFVLQNHQEQPFYQTTLLGKWHLISYGYLNCPDICPTTLMTLSYVADQVKTLDLNSEVKFIFYTVDPDRDQAKQLLSYLDYFNSDFIGLRATNDKDKDLFEQSLAMKVDVSIRQDTDLSYAVSHDVAIFVINPDGNLQAVLKPKSNALRTQPFSSDIIFEDFLQVFHYYQSG